VALHKIHQEVSDLGLTRLVVKAVIGNRLGVSHFINADDQRLEMVVSLVHAYVHKKQSNRNDCQAKHADFQVEIADQHPAELLNVMTPGSGELILGQRHNLTGTHLAFPSLFVLPTRYC
jgi:hypothetical protein